MREVMLSSPSYKVFRRVVVLVFFGIFVWQTSESLSKYLDGNTTFTLKTLREDEQPFPGISICQSMSVIDAYEQQLSANLAPSSVREEPEMSFREELEMARPRFRLSFLHQGVNNETVSVLDEDGNLAEHWQSVVTVSSGLNAQLLSCYSYNAPGLFFQGMRSFLNLRIESNGQRSTHLFVHPPGDNLLIGNRNQGRLLQILNPMPEPLNQKVEMFEIASELNHILSLDHLPCHEMEGNDAVALSMHQCLEDYVENLGKCALPWRLKDNSSLQTRECPTSFVFKKMSEMYFASSEEETYQLTGCYKQCLFPKYSLNTVFSESAHNPALKHLHLHEIMLYLAPGGVSLQEEVPVYDLLDLVGNVGGFMGLLLGASLLSLMDEGKDLLGRILK